MKHHARRAIALVLGSAIAFPGGAIASSHREAPFITKMPKVDGTDLYAFSSYESGKKGMVTILANYQPLQDPTGGPNFFMMDPDALYEIHVDNNGDAKEDLTFQFRFQNELKNITLPVGTAGAEKNVGVPLINVGPVSDDDTANLNVLESYSLGVVRGDRRTGTATVIGGSDATASFTKPVDNIGAKSIPGYDAYAASHIHEVDIPGCTPSDGQKSRVFVGQRREGFSVNIGEIADLLNLKAPLGDADQGKNDLRGKNVTTLALEIPASCLTASAENPVIGVWTTASVRQARVVNPTATFSRPSREGGAWAQVSRLGMPLVNEVIIGIGDKDRFNGSHPSGDAQFLDYVTHPALPEIVELIFGPAGVVAPDAFPRADLVAAFLTGVEGVNMTATPSEMLRLNTAIPPTAKGSQNPLGAAACFEVGVLNLDADGCDPAGFPNGRRPGDDVVDIELRVAMGYLLSEEAAPSGRLPFTDGAAVSDASFPSSFPYLRAPLGGAK